MTFAFLGGVPPVFGDLFSGLTAITSLRGRLRPTPSNASTGPCLTVCRPNIVCIPRIPASVFVLPLAPDRTHSPIIGLAPTSTPRYCSVGAPSMSTHSVGSRWPIQSIVKVPGGIVKGFRPTSLRLCLLLGSFILDYPCSVVSSLALCSF